MMTTGILILSVGLLSAAPEETAWTGFRGPVPASVHSDQLPVTWAPAENIVWQAKIDGYGQSSPVVWGEDVYVTSVEGPNKESCKVTAFRLATGEGHWQFDIKNATPQEASNYVSKAAPTPVVDDFGVIALFEGGNLIALKHDGNMRWQYNLVEKYGPVTSRHGLGSSLAQDDNLVFVWIERQDDPYLLAINKATGEEFWKVPGLKATSWSTPVLLTVGDTQQLVIAGNGIIRGHNPGTGEILWTLEGVSGNTTPSPQPAGDGLLLLGATGGRGGEGVAKATPSNAMVKVEKQADGKFAAQIHWKAKRATCSFGSPIVHQGLAYYVNVTGVLFCLDATTGDEVYSQRIGDSVWATPLAVDDRIYFVGKKGVTTVVQAGREFKQLAQNRLWVEEDKQEAKAEATKEGEKKSDEKKADEKAGSEEKKSGGRGRGPEASSVGVLYAVAAVPGRLLIRRGDVLYCVGNEAESTAKP